MLEEEVEEKYYLSDEKVSKIQTGNFMQEKKRKQEEEVCGTILARDWKDTKCVRVGGMYGQSTRWGLYDDEGISPTLVAAMGEGGGYVPMVKRIGGIFDTQNSKHQAGSIYDKNGLAPTLTDMQGGYRQPCIQVKNATKKGYDEAIDGDSVNLQYPNSETRRGRVGHQLSQTIMANDNIGVVEKVNVIGNYMPSGHDASRIVDSRGLAPTVKENHGTVTATMTNLRIRKLTPKECWRLMGFSDEDFEKAGKINSNTQLYKQAGNSIVVNVLMAIFEQLF